MRLLRTQSLGLCWIRRPPVMVLARSLGRPRAGDELTAQAEIFHRVGQVIHRGMRAQVTLPGDQVAAPSGDVVLDDVGLYPGQGLLSRLEGGHGRSRLL